MLCCSHDVHHVTLAPIGSGGSSSNNVMLINDIYIAHQKRVTELSRDGNCTLKG